jgi:hypothetical protein
MAAKSASITKVVTYPTTVTTRIPQNSASVLNTSIRKGLFTTALTTVYTEPSSCASQWYFHGITDPPPSVRGGPAPTPVPWVDRGFRDKVGLNRPGGDLPVDCNPYPRPGQSGGGTTWDGLSMVMFSPGICPGAYWTVHATYISEEQHNYAVCCPT